MNSGRPLAVNKLCCFACSVAALVAIVVALSSNAGAHATEKVLHTFTNGAGGGAPFGLVSDAGGNLYGMAQTGGNLSNCSGFGCGIVFELSPNPSGGWTETVLYAFAGGADGAFPEAGLIFDASGNLYGMTNSGGSSNSGVVFELSPSGGSWKELVLYTFTGGSDGGRPGGNLVFDNAGSLYGTTGFGGDLGCKASFSGCGTVFKLAPTSGGSWQGSVLFTFNGGNGASPAASLVFDAVGNLYSTTVEGGNASRCSRGCGVVFELSPTSSGPWKETVLHAFTGDKDGALPVGGLVFDGTGNLYGTTSAGGNGTCPSLGCGVAFELSPTGDNRWKEAPLHSFSGGADGAFPFAGLVLDPAGNLYGTTEVGGFVSPDVCPSGCGVVYELSRASNGSWKEVELHAFRGTDGATPYTGLMLDATGNLYGSAQGSTPSSTEIFQITP